VALGAEVLTGPVEEPGSVFIVHADPAGHPFCLCWDRPSVDLPGSQTTRSGPMVTH
jgi:hypothetical protein